MARRLAGDRRQRLQEGIEIGDVGRLHARIGGIGKSRIVVLAAGRNALQHGVGEILERPGADAVAWDRCEMFGATKMPNGVFSSSPPASCSAGLAFRFRPAWQDVQPPAQKMRSPLAASPVPSAATVCGVEPCRRRQEPERQPRRRRPERGRRRRAFPSRPIRPRSALLDAIGLVAAAASRRRWRRPRLQAPRRPGRRRRQPQRRRRP